MNDTTPPPPDDPNRLNTLSNWYAGLQLPCPFLNKNICEIYHQRPLACREHLVTGLPGPCKGQKGKAELINIPLPMTDVLSQLAADLEDEEPQALLLPLAPLWCEENLKRADRTWPARKIAQQFAKALKTVTENNHTQAAR